MQIYDAYSFTVIPAVGKVVTGDGQPYRYLVESIRTFPKQEEFARHDCRGGLRQRDLPQSHRRRRRHSFGLAHLMFASLVQHASAVAGRAARWRRYDALLPPEQLADTALARARSA